LVQVIVKSYYSNDPWGEPDQSKGVTPKLHLDVEVKDNGPGIPLKYQPLLFKAFNKVPDRMAKYTNPKDFGLSLYMSKRICE